METEKADREARSLPRLLNRLTELGDAITKLILHAEAAAYPIGANLSLNLAPSPLPGENVSPMERALRDVGDFIQWIHILDSGFEKALEELVPDFYEQHRSEPMKPR